MTCVPDEPMSMPTADQRDVVLDPDRVVFERAVGVELEMIVVVIGVAVVLVHEILAEDMVGERVALFLVVIVGHSRRAPRNISRWSPCRSLSHAADAKSGEPQARCSLHRARDGRGVGLLHEASPQAPRIGPRK